MHNKATTQAHLKDFCQMNDSQAFEFGLSNSKNCVLCKRKKMKPKIQSILVYVELLLGGSRSSLVSHDQFANDNFAIQHAFHVHFVGKPCKYILFFLAVISIGR